jgi:hypothetical protein
MRCLLNVTPKQIRALEFDRGQLTSALDLERVKLQSLRAERDSDEAVDQVSHRCDCS